MLVAFIAAAGVGVNMSQSAIWAPPTVVLALAAWDLERFGARLRLADASQETRELERRHLWRLLAVSGLSLVLAFAAMGLASEARHGCRVGPRIPGDPGAEPGHPVTGARKRLKGCKTRTRSRRLS